MLLTLGGRGGASINDVPTIINVMLTLAGWRQFWITWISFGGFGALGGIAFLLALKMTDDGIPSKETVPSVARRTPLVTSCLAVLAILLTGTALEIPNIVLDRTWHNMFRDGRTSVRPKVYVRLSISMEDWQQLIRTFEDFGADGPRRLYELRNLLPSVAPRAEDPGAGRVRLYLLD